MIYLSEIMSDEKEVPLSQLVFEKYDRNKDGILSPSEFHFLVYDMGYYLSPKEREIAYKKMDTYFFPNPPFHS